MKQGPLTQVVGKKEMAKHCILFNNYIALAQAHNTQYRIMEVCNVNLSVYSCMYVTYLVHAHVNYMYVTDSVCDYCWHVNVCNYICICTCI